MHGQCTPLIAKNEFESLPDGTVRVTLSRGLFGYVDAADWERVRHYRWYAGKAKNTFYMMTNVWLGGGKGTTLLAHRLICDASPDVQVDHRDGDGLNNRGSNLRTATHSDNQHNQRPRRNSSSGYKGVTWESHHGRWRARIRVDGVRRHIGFFTTAEEAARAYDIAAREHHGEYASLNFPETDERAGS